VLAAFHDYLDQAVVLWWWAVLLALVFPAPEADADDPRNWVRLAVGFAAAGIVIWGIVQPAYARLLWWGRPSTPALAERALRAEPWLVETVQWRLQSLLGQPAWSWETTAEALAWSERITRINPGGATSWSLRALANTRIIEELGAWPDAVSEARRGYRMATDLEPHLPWSWLRWAQLERSLNRLREAERLAARAVVAEPNFVRGWLFLARLRFDLGRVEDAREARDRAVAASALAGRRSLTEYESDLLRAPTWQLEELARVLD
jgi:tetratricopeptide (TPR) repeat protein